MTLVADVHYQYDAAGNRIAMTAGGKVTAYQYNAANEMVKAGATTYTYDKNGNLIKKDTPNGSITYSYTGDNLLKQVSNPDGTGVNYTYDANRQMVTRVMTYYVQKSNHGKHNGAGHGKKAGQGKGGSSTSGQDAYQLETDTTNYLYDGSNLLKEYGAHGDPLAEYYTANNQVIGRQMFGLHDTRQLRDEGTIQTRGGMMYYEYDGLGNVMDITDHLGNNVMSYRYDAFGNLFTQMAAPYNDLGYTGQLYVPEASLLYLSARWYSPNVGRFTTMDTYPGVMTNPQTLNLYAYTGNNPVNYTDPTGHMPTWSGSQDGGSSGSSSGSSGSSGGSGSGGSTSSSGSSGSSSGSSGSTGGTSSSGGGHHHDHNPNPQPTTAQLEAQDQATLATLAPFISASPISIAASSLYAGSQSAFLSNPGATYVSSAPKHPVVKRTDEMGVGGGGGGGGTGSGGLPNGNPFVNLIKWVLNKFGVPLDDSVDGATQAAAKGTGNMPTANLDSLPENVQSAYNKYEKNSWQGNVSGQTPGTKAGGTYENDNGQLPTTTADGEPITYKEFDVNNKVPGQNRDGERFVKGSDGSIYYTDAHYDGGWVKIK